MEPGDTMDRPLIERIASSEERIASLEEKMKRLLKDNNKRDFEYQTLKGMYEAQNAQTSSLKDAVTRGVNHVTTVCELPQIKFVVGEILNLAIGNGHIGLTVPSFEPPTSTSPMGIVLQRTGMSETDLHALISSY